MASAAPPPLEVTESSRTTAAAVHIGTIFSPIAVPLLVGFARRREDPFVSAHAFYALRHFLLLKIVLVGTFVGSVVTGALRVAYLLSSGDPNPDWRGMILRGVGVFLVLALLELANINVARRNAEMAQRGIWPGEDSSARR